MFNSSPVSETPHTTKGERTRARILEAALELFREQGVEGATVREVAEQRRARRVL